MGCYKRRPSAVQKTASPSTKPDTLNGQEVVQEIFQNSLSNSFHPFILFVRFPAMESSVSVAANKNSGFKNLALKV